MREQLTETLQEASGHVGAAWADAQEARSVSDAHELLSAIASARADLVEAEAQAVALWRSWGASWQEVADFYGVSRQAAWERWSDHGGGS